MKNLIIMITLIGSFNVQANCYPQYYAYNIQLTDDIVKSSESVIITFCETDTSNQEYCRGYIRDCSTYASVSECSEYYVEDYHYRMNHAKFFCIEE